MLNKKSIDDINVKGKRVLCRCDFNVPLDGSRITDETRLVAALPTIKKLIADGGKVILCSHLGKPKGPDAAFSLAPVAKRLSELLGQEVKFAADDTVVGDNARAAVAAMNDGDVILLENTRFRPEETKNGEAFSKDLASIADVFVNDAFGTAHRAHCSNVGVTQYVDTAVVGYLMQKEIDFLGNAVNNPVRPFVAILGGSKVSSKISVINNLLDKVDTLIIGGGMSYTFQKAHGGNVGQSLVEDDYLDYAKDMMKKAEEKGVKPFEIPVAVDAIVPIVNPKNTLNGLSLDDLRKIYKGEIKNWKEVGGPDAPIVLVSRDSSSGTFESWESLVMKNQRVSPRALLQNSNGTVVQTVSKNPNAIGYVGLGYVAPIIKAVEINGIKATPLTAKEGKWPLSRDLYLYTNRQPQGAVKKVTDFCLSEEGRGLIKEAGFVPPAKQ